MNYDSDNVEFFVTLETLEVIVKGLGMNHGDSSLAVCSAGCVPFALSFFGQVVAVDKSQTQLRYAEKRRDDFVNGGSIIPSEYSNFVNARNVQRYFLNLIEEVRRSVGNITFLRRDLMHVVPMGIFNKVYLSNILDWRESYSDEEEVDLFNKLIRRMPFG